MMVTIFTTIMMMSTIIIIRTQKIALLCVQRAIRNYMVGKLWPWWQVSSIYESLQTQDMKKGYEDELLRGLRL